MIRITRMRLSQEGGSASLEFITAGVLLLVPLVYLVLILGRIQSASLAVEGAARQAARVYVTASTSAKASQQATLAVSDALTDVRLSPQAARTVVTCSPSRAACLTVGEWVKAQVSVDVDLPVVPHVFGLDRLSRVTITASATEEVLP